MLWLNPCRDNSCLYLKHKRLYKWQHIWHIKNSHNRYTTSLQDIYVLMQSFLLLYDDSAASWMSFLSDPGLIVSYLTVLFSAATKMVTITIIIWLGGKEWSVRRIRYEGGYLYYSKNDSNSSNWSKVVGQCVLGSIHTTLKTKGSRLIFA